MAGTKKHAILQSLLAQSFLETLVTQERCRDLVILTNVHGFLSYQSVGQPKDTLKTMTMALECS